MGKLCILLLLALPLAACATDGGYSRADVDAINAETQCRNMARTLVQAQRCGVKRW
jgi:hypothetical protein